ncbi:helix-turn-helix domain-containing protein [Chengkuizengella sp. SCS-71B]|uniref:helix-turn-helix domain-containing protein n=1 Tax=Chengkuizengella sp. SCS-71B TaxID=3115290 RepID=UPI0032C218BD
MNFSKTIKKYLNERELNASDLARMTGYSPQYIHDLLKGDRRWNENTIDKVCDALKLEIKFLTIK